MKTNNDNDIDKTEDDEFIKDIDEFIEKQRHLSDALKKLIEKLEKENPDENDD